MKSALFIFLVFFTINLFAQSPYPLATGAKVSNGTTSQGFIIFVEDYDNGQNTMTIQPPASLAGNIVYTFPGIVGTNGQVLTTNGANPAVLSWTTPSGGGGTSYWDSTANNLFPRDLTNYVGIGTAAPTAKLTIKADVPIAFLVEDTTSTSFLTIGTSGAFSINTKDDQLNIDNDVTNFRIDGSNGLLKYSSVGGNIFFTIKPDSTAYFSGNVGIHTNSPTSKLEVDGTFSALVPNHSGAHGFLSTELLTSMLAANADASHGGDIDIDSTGTSRYHTTGGNILMQPDVGNGNVGIGVTNPAYKLEVNATGDVFKVNNPSGESQGFILFGNGVGGLQSFVANAAFTRSTTINQNNSIVAFGITYDNLANNFGVTIDSVNGFSIIGSEFADSALIVRNYNGDVIMTPAVGNVGIGTASPAHKLDVVGEIWGKAKGAAQYHNLVAVDDNDTIMSGLVVYENYAQLYASTHGTLGPNITLNSSLGGLGMTIQTPNASGGIGITTSAITDHIVMQTDAAAGNVGIGTASPAYKLDVLGTGHIVATFSPGFYSESIFGGKGISLNSYHVAATENDVSIGNLGISMVSIDSSLGVSSDVEISPTLISLKNDSGVVILQETTGNVGIGTASPFRKLTVISTGTGNGTYFKAGNNSSLDFDSTAYYITVNAPNIGGATGTFQYNHWNLNANNLASSLVSNIDGDTLGVLKIFSTDKIVMQDGGGNVGIGTHIPQAKLHVVGDSIEYQSGNTNHTLSIKWDIDDSLFRISSPTGDTIAIGSATAKFIGDQMMLGNTLFTNTDAGDGKVYQFKDNVGKFVAPTDAGLMTIDAATTAISTMTSSIATKAATSSLASVATSGAYTDLSGKPTIPTDNNQLANGSGYLTSVTAIPYKSYQAKLTQSSTGAPTVVEYVNTTGGTMTWARSSSGVYTCTANSAVFTANKTHVIMGAPSNGLISLSPVNTSTTVVTLNTGLLALGVAVPTDGQMTNILYEIRIYP